MARIRTVKPMLFRHEGLFEAERDHQLPLRLAFIGLFTCCDREGRFEWRPSHLKLDIFPYDNVDIIKILDTLTNRGFIQKYQAGEKCYGVIPSWHKHQRIDHHEMQSECPSPPGWVRPVFATAKKIRKSADVSRSRQPKAPVVKSQEILDQNSTPSLVPVVLPTACQPSTELNIGSERTLMVVSPSPVNQTVDKPSSSATVSLEELQAVDQLQAAFESKHSRDSVLSNSSSINSQTQDKEKRAVSTVVSPSSDVQNTPANPISGQAASDAQSNFFRLLQKCPGMPRGNMEYGMGNREHGVWNREYGETKGNRVIPNIVESKIRPNGIEPVQQVFEYWKAVMKHPNAKFDSKRRRLISKALKSGYQPQELCQAIQGCSLTPHNMGDNDRGQRYDGLHVILRDADQIERFIHNCQYPPKPIHAADRQTQGNLYAVQRWMEKRQERKTYAAG